VHQIYTFGAPMIGNDLAAEAFDREFPGRIFRYVKKGKGKGKRGKAKARKKAAKIRLFHLVTAGSSSCGPGCRS